MNSCLLGAPREYVLHGLVPGLDWVNSGLSLWAYILLPCSTQYLAIYLNGSGLTPNAFLLSGWLLTNVQVNNITMLHDICAHMYTHHIGITILLFLLHFFHSSWQAGWSGPFPSDTCGAVINHPPCKPQKPVATDLCGEMELPKTVYEWLWALDELFSLPSPCCWSQLLEKQFMFSVSGNCLHSFLVNNVNFCAFSKGR